MRRLSETGSAGSRRAVSYELEFCRETWTLMAVDTEGQKYLVSTYEDQIAAEQAFQRLNRKQDQE